MACPDIQIRESIKEDLPALEALYPAAFPDEDLLPLVRQLVDNRHDVLSLIGVAGGNVVAHAAFSECGIEGRGTGVALLGPVAVSPDWQRQGIGRHLIDEGVERVRTMGHARVLVLGDPEYYGRLGFTADDAVMPPYQLPEEWRSAWQSIKLLAAPLSGTLLVPEPWRPAALWLP